MDKRCLDCDEKITGRSDKKFCSDQCRNNYNNRLNSDANSTVRNVNNILRKNRRILSELVPEDKITVHKNKLADRGFNFSYHTNIYTTKKGAAYYFCYEYGYLPLSSEMYMIVHRKGKEEEKGVEKAE